MSLANGLLRLMDCCEFCVIFVMGQLIVLKTVGVTILKSYSSEILFVCWVDIVTVFEGVGPMLEETNLVNPDSLNFFLKMKLNNHFYAKLRDILYECVQCSPSSHIVK